MRVVVRARRQKGPGRLWWTWALILGEMGAGVEFQAEQGWDLTVF